MRADEISSAFSCAGSARLLHCGPSTFRNTTAQYANAIATGPTKASDAASLGATECGAPSTTSAKGRRRKAAISICLGARAMRANGDDRDRPRDGSRNQHGIGKDLLPGVSLERWSRNRQHAQQAKASSEQGSAQRTLAQPPRSERDDPDWRREGEHGSSPGRQDSQRQGGQR